MKAGLKDKMKKLFKRFFKFLWKVTIKFVNFFSPTLATKLVHYKVTGDLLNLKRPISFNEKLQWLKLYWHDPLILICADKYEVYNYVKENGDPSILNNLIAVYDKAEDIVWEDLPEKFALKCTHGCGYNIVTADKSSLDSLDVIEKMRVWLKEIFGESSLEYHYAKIRPRIILEEYIENKEGLLPLDYKIYCFNGVAKLVLVCSERDDGLKLDFFDLEWNRLNIGYKKNESDKEIVKPSCFYEMTKHAEMLAKPFPFVRVDFYDKDGIPILGELTFTPAANMANYYNEYGKRYLGDLLVLPDNNFKEL